MKHLAFCALVAISIGSSWTVAGTMGIGLMAIAASFNLSPAITAGAIVSGAYFGDKLSPLSDSVVALELRATPWRTRSARRSTTGASTQAPPKLPAHSASSARAVKSPAAGLRSDRRA